MKQEHLDRFIPCRTKESLQAKFEAASQNQNEFWHSKNKVTVAAESPPAATPRAQPDAEVQ